MPRAVEIVVAPERRPELLARLKQTEGVAAVFCHAGASIQPPGDLVVMHGTNQAAESATRIAAELDLVGKGCVSLGEPVGLVSGERRSQIGADSSEATWEEIDTLLRRDTNVSHNFLALMALSGAVAGAGLLLDTLHIVIGAMLIAPGFEPLVRIVVGLASGLADTARKGVSASLVGYLVLAAGAAAGAVLTAWADPRLGLADIPEQSWVVYWSTFSWTGAVIALIAGFAGAVVVNSHQTVLATGVMVALALIPSIAVFGMGLVAGEVGLALRGLGRWAVEASCVVAASACFFALKRRLVGRGAEA